MTILETERLILRPWHTDDAEFVLDLYPRREVQRFIVTQPRVITSMAEAGEIIGTWRAQRVRTRIGLSHRGADGQVLQRPMRAS